MVTLCHVFGVHRSSYRYWKNRPEKPDGRRAVLRSQVLELHGISHGSAGARSIATMATRRGYQMGRWLAGRLMKELGLSAVSSRLTGINVVVMNMLLSLTTLKGSSP
ncbi:transposase ORF B, IS911 [Shigella flexneri SFJ17B]|nr:transposase ORF B, IS911 [Shigella flexneri SFJ17B]